MAQFTSQPRVHKWACSTTGWVLMWNGDSGTDTWCPAMEPMSQIMFYNHLQWACSTTGWVLMWNGDSGTDTWCPAIPMSQIMFYNHLATFGTIYKSAKVGWGTGTRPWNQCLKSCFIIIWLLAQFTSQSRVHKWACSTTGWVLMWNGDSGTDTWCPAMEPMSQIMFYNHLATFGTIYKSAKGPQVGRFHNGMGPDVERVTVVRTPGVRPWNQCLKSCFIIIWQLLAPFTSQPRSTSGPVPQRDGS